MLLMRPIKSDDFKKIKCSKIPGNVLPGILLC